MNDINFHCPSLGSEQALDSGRTRGQAWQMSANSHHFLCNCPGSRRLIKLMLVAIAFLCGFFAPDSMCAPGRGPAAARRGKTAEDTARAAELMQKYRNDLVLVEGKAGKASAFIADINGRKYLVTNAHVLADIKSPHFKLIDNTPIKLGPGRVAVGHDIIMLEVVEGGKGIPTVAFGAPEAQFGDAVVVPGDPGGEGVVVPLHGEIVGIGADRLEVSAPIEPGSSGSPIIHLSSGKVIGVATYLKINPILSRSRPRVSNQSNVRRFGYRLDSVQRWEPADWARFYAQADAMAKIQSNTGELESAFEDISSSSRFRQQKHSYDSRVISGALDQYCMALKQGSRNNNEAAKRLLVALRTVGQSDIAVKVSFTYDFFRREFEQEETKRKEMMEFLDKALEMMR
jgi:hypothetical protein